MLYSPRLSFLGLAALLTSFSQASAALTHTPEEASRVRILLVIDTQAENAQGLGLALGGDKLKRVLKESLRQQRREDRYTLDVLTGADVTPENILDYYRHLKTEPNEALLFYYTGHGAVDQFRGHYLDLDKRGRLYRSTLRAAMLQKNARLVAILTDSCANLTGNEGISPRGRKAPPLNSFLAPTPAKTSSAGVSWKPDPVGHGTGTVLWHLLFHHCGLVDINGAAMGKLAYANRDLGGYFTATLADLLSEPVARFDTNGDHFVEWSEFFALLRRNTEHGAPAGTGGSYSQTPTAFALGTEGKR
jgi:hypothetical protein